MKQLTSEGIGTERKSAEPITQEMEPIFWETVIFSVSKSDGLLNAIYFYNSKFFGLRAGDEHHNLCVEQYSFGSDTLGEYMMFNGSYSKTYQGGLRHRKLISPRIYSCPEVGETLFELNPFYRGILSKTLCARSQVFYSGVGNDHPWKYDSENVQKCMGGDQCQNYTVFVQLEYPLAIAVWVVHLGSLLIWV